MDESREFKPQSHCGAGAIAARALFGPGFPAATRSPARSTISRLPQDVLGPVDVLVNNAGIAWPVRCTMSTTRSTAASSRRTCSGRSTRRAAWCSSLLASRRARRPRVHQLRRHRATPAEDARVRSEQGGARAPRAHARAWSSKARASDRASCASARRSPSFGDGWDLQIFESLLPEWQRFGLQRHWNTMDVADVARAVVMVVTSEPGMSVPLVELQPTPPRVSSYLIAVGATGAPTACVSGSGVAESRKSYWPSAAQSAARSSRCHT